MTYIVWQETSLKNQFQAQLKLKIVMILSPTGQILAHNEIPFLLEGYKWIRTCIYVITSSIQIHINDLGSVVVSAASDLSYNLMITM